jgi:hypothetical protein
MRGYMLSAEGALPEAQQEALLRTLRRLMTPVLPPFYRLFMAWLVPSVERGDPKWLQDSVQAVATRLPGGLSKGLAPGAQLGPAPYAPLLTSVVAPFAFGFLVRRLCPHTSSTPAPGTRSWFTASLLVHGIASCSRR